MAMGMCIGHGHGHGHGCGCGCGRGRVGGGGVRAVGVARGLRVGCGVQLGPNMGRIYVYSLFFIYDVTRNEQQNNTE